MKSIKLTKIHLRKSKLPKDAYFYLSCCSLFIEERDYKIISKEEIK